MRTAALLLVAACAACGADEPARRSVVLVVIDTLRADHTTLAGHARDTTPRLDAFARGARVFDSARASASWTKPSVATILTGLDPRAHGVTTHIAALHSGHRTLAEAFREAGYDALGVQSNIYLRGGWGFAQGFRRYADELPSAEGSTLATHDRSTGARVNELALEWADELEPGRPFFLYVHHYEPHHMYLRDELARGDFGLDAERRAALAEATMGELVGAVDELAPADAAYLAARYDSEILYQDRLLGDLFDGLGERGLLEGAVVAVTSDHGEEFLEHGGVSHPNDKLFDELLRVPLLVSAPGLAPGREATPVGLANLGRTLLDLAGLEAAPFPGASLVPRGGETPAARPVFAHGTIPAGEGRTHTELDAVVSGRFKLVRDLVAGTGALYDLETDPGERTDVSAAHPDELARLRDLAAAFAAGEGRRRDLGPEPPEVRSARAAHDAEMDAYLEKLGYTGP